MITKEEFEKEWNEAQGGDYWIVVLEGGGYIETNKYEFDDSLDSVRLYSKSDFIGTISLARIVEVD